MPNILDKLQNIDDSLKNLLQDNIKGRQTIIQSLGNDIRIVSKVLSSLIR